MDALRKFAMWFADLILPRDEHVKELESLDACGMRAALPVAERGSGGNFRAFSLFNYGDVRTRTLVWEIKYRGNERLVAVTAELLHDAALESAADLNLFGCGIPLLIPVPLHPERLRERGWNQSELLARRMHGLSPSSYEFAPSALVKTKHTPPQTKLARAERLKNLKGCFSASRPERIKGRTIFLVDDVTTTGATLEEARKTLLDAGAREVMAFTVAH